MLIWTSFERHLDLLPWDVFTRLQSVKKTRVFKSNEYRLCINMNFALHGWFRSLSKVVVSNIHARYGVVLYVKILILEPQINVQGFRLQEHRVRELDVHTLKNPPQGVKSARSWISTVVIAPCITSQGHVHMKSMSTLSIYLFHLQSKQLYMRWNIARIIKVEITTKAVAGWSVTKYECDWRKLSQVQSCGSCLKVGIRSKNCILCCLLLIPSWRTKSPNSPIRCWSRCRRHLWVRFLKMQEQRMSES